MTAPLFAADTTDYLLNSNSVAGFDTFVMKIDDFTKNGLPIKVPGLNSDYALYIEGIVAVAGSPSVYGPGMIAVVLDPTNNDGTLSSTFNNSTETGSVSFSNPAGQADDITLASGQFVSGAFGTQSNGQPGLQLVNTFNPDPGLNALLRGATFNLSTEFFNTATSRVQPTSPAGITYVLQNGGFGVVTLQQTGAASSDTVPLTHILTALDKLQFLRGRC
jgi:hypothetical protein